MSVDHRRTLQPASRNPWYILATLHGEYENTIHFDDRDSIELCARNRETWNLCLNKPELLEESDELKRIYRARLGDEKANLPNLGSKIDFADCLFDKPVSFGGFAFPTEVDFNRSIFRKSVSFQASVFEKITMFGGTHFGSPFAEDEEQICCANFRKAVFKGFVLFGATFDHVQFDMAIFEKLLKFEARCNQRERALGISFAQAKFEQVIFRGVCFGAHSHATIFKGSYFGGDADFESMFFGGADFQRCEFKGSLKLSRARFKFFVPDFRDTPLMEASEFDETEWPPAPESIKAAYDQIHAYERLKAEMERQKRSEQELVFLGLELRARRALLALQAKDAKYSAWALLKARQLLNYLYYFFSNYGQSAGRPALCLIALCAVTTGLLALSQSYNDEPVRFGKAIEISLTSAFPILPFKAHEVSASDLSPFSKALANFHSLLSAVLLFLIGLGLRNRFRMK